MRIMGIDYGERRTGIAVSDPLGFTAQAVGTVNHKTPDEALTLVLAKIEEIKPEKIVLGMPKNMDGSIGFRGEATKKFADMLKDKIDTPIIFWDERLSTVSAIPLNCSGSVKCCLPGDKNLFTWFTVFIPRAYSIFATAKEMPLRSARDFTILSCSMLSCACGTIIIPSLCTVAKLVIL